MTYRTHAEINQMYQNLCDAYPEWCDYLSVGKTYLNNDIMMFRIGDPSGGRILYDSAIHGWEDVGAEIGFLFLKWLLESGEQKANTILNSCYWLFIPVVNYDSLGRTNMHIVCNPAYCQNGEFGVDLNRNFVRNWKSSSCRTDTNPDNINFCINPFGQLNQILCGDPTYGKNVTHQYQCVNGSWQDLGVGGDCCDPSANCTSPTGLCGQIICGNSQYGQNITHAYQCRSGTWTDLGISEKCQCESSGGNWWNDHCCTGYPNNYHGDFAGSEPETQVMRSVFQNYRPKFYVNTHYGGGPWFGHYSAIPQSTIDPLKNRIIALASEMGVGCIWPWSSTGGNGVAVGDAYDFGAISFLWEMYSRGTSDNPNCKWGVCANGIDCCEAATLMGKPEYAGLCSTTNPDYEYVEHIVFPKSMPYFLALSEFAARTLDDRVVLEITVS